MRRQAIFATVLAFAGVAAPAQAVEHDPGVTALEQAREESGVQHHPPTRFALPAGELELSAAELLAAHSETLLFTVTLDRPVSDGKLTLTLPARWAADSAVSDLPFARVPGGDRTLELAFGGAQAGDTKSVAIKDVGIPAGTYKVAYRWTEAGASPAEGTATVILFAPVREGAEKESSNPWARLAAPALSSTRPAMR